MRKKIFICFVLALSNLLLFSQDIHFSQFDATPLNLNPAQAGYTSHDYRIVLNHRNQWQSVTVPYLTISGSFEGKTNRFHFNIPGYWGYGLLINADKAGDGNFGTTQIKLTGAYHYPIKSKYLKRISLGSNIAYNYQSVDFSKFYFGNQFNGTYYNPYLPHNEVFKSNSISFIDFSTGMEVENKIGKTPLIWGFSFHHLNTPQESFNDAPIELDRKITVYALMTLSINTANYFQPSLYYYRQGILTEFSFGSLFFHETSGQTIPVVFIGGWMRYQDAVIIKGGFDYQAFRIGLSYDINFSKLTVASHGKGGYELSIIYLFDKPLKNNLIYHKQCPSLM